MNNTRHELQNIGRQLVSLRQQMAREQNDSRYREQAQAYAQLEQRQAQLRGGQR